MKSEAETIDILKYREPRSFYCCVALAFHCCSQVLVSGANCLLHADFPERLSGVITFEWYLPQLQSLQKVGVAEFGMKTLRENRSLPVEPLTHSNFRFQADHLAVPSAIGKHIPLRCPSLKDYNQDIIKVSIVIFFQ